MAAATVTSVSGNLAANGGPGSSAMRSEVFKVVPATPTDATLWIPLASIRTLSHVTGFLVCICQDAALTAASAEQYSFDLDLDTTKHVNVLGTDGAKITRQLTGATALVSRTYLITLFGY